MEILNNASLDGQHVNKGSEDKGLMDRFYHSLPNNVRNGVRLVLVSTTLFLAGCGGVGVGDTFKYGGGKYYTDSDANMPSPCQYELDETLTVTGVEGGYGTDSLPVDAVTVEDDDGCEAVTFKPAGW